MTVTGKIHSIETCGTVDGPGIRYVFFTQGCPFRCLYCHNPDTWSPRGGTTYSVEALMADIRKYKAFMRFSGGGVTATGGDPLLQAAFVEALFRACREENIHTTLDTSGCLPPEKAAGVLSQTDLVLLDIKALTPEDHEAMTGVRLSDPLRFARHLSEIKKPTWIRYVVIPGITDAPVELETLALFLKGLKNVERVELLAFHKMGEYKWKELGLDYRLENVPAADERVMEKAASIFRRHGLPVR